MPQKKELVQDIEDKELEMEEAGNLLFPGSPSEKELEEMKELAGGELYITNVSGTFFIWRPLKRKEYKSIMAIENADAFFREEKICETCILWPSDTHGTIRLGRAGYASTLAETISEESGFTTNVQTFKL